MFILLTAVHLKFRVRACHTGHEQMTDKVMKGEVFEKLALV